MNKVLLILFSLTGYRSYGQVYIDYAPVGAVRHMEIFVHGPDAANAPIPYSRFAGSPFWKEEFTWASLYHEAQKLGSLPVRINLATQEIHFMKDSLEMVALPRNEITMIIMHEGRDTSKSVAFFVSVPGPRTGATSWCQMLNTGRYALLKRRTKLPEARDSLFGTQKRYVFREEVSYFLKADDKVHPLRKWDAEHILSLCPNGKNYARWLAQQGNKRKREQEVVDFLTYYNAMQME
jgi:hypothetical protein